MKKLMILGGSRYALPVIKAAHEMGIYVVTCDYLPNNIAHHYSDEYCNVSIIDQEATLAAAKRIGISGITSFACDPGVITAAFVAEQMHLPNVGPYESVCILQNKGLFRTFLKEHGFNVPFAQSYTCIENALQDSELFPWPIIVKPTDSAGSKGVSRVDSPQNLRIGIENALKASRKKEFIIEEFIQQQGFSSDTDSFSIEGEMVFVSFNSQRFDSSAINPYTPSGYTWPSSMRTEQETELRNEIQRLIKLLNMGTSIYNIETRVGTNNKTYIMECSPRGGGNRLAEILRYATSVDLIKNTVKAVMGEPCDQIEQLPYNGFWGEIVLHSERAGRFSGLSIDSSIRKSIIEEDLWVKPGDHVGEFTGANESLGTVIMRFDRQDVMERVMADPQRYIRVITDSVSGGKTT